MISRLAGAIITIGNLICDHREPDILAGTTSSDTLHSVPYLAFPASKHKVAITTDKCLYGMFEGKQELDAVPVDRETGCSTRQRLTRHGPDMLHNSPCGLSLATDRYLMDEDTTKCSHSRDPKLRKVLRRNCSMAVEQKDLCLKG